VFQALLAIDLGVRLIGLAWKLRMLILIIVAARLVVGYLGLGGLGAAPSGPGITYSRSQLSEALQVAGVPGDLAPIGAAVALAESGGRSDAVCDSCVPGVREYSVGPWQINLYAHPDVTASCAMELYCAARAAASISRQGRDWSAWSTYDSGAFGAFIAP